MNKKSLKQISIKKQLLILFMLISVIPLLIFAGVYSITTVNSISNTQISFMKQLSSLITDNLDNWISDNILYVEEIAHSSDVINNDINAISSTFKSKASQDGNIINIMYANTQGTVLADGLGSNNLSVAATNYHTTALEGYTYTSDIIMNENNVPMVVFATPVKHNGAITGSIILQLKANVLNRLMGNLVYNKDLTISAFNREGYVTYDSKNDTVMTENFLEAPDQNLQVAATYALEGNMNSLKIKRNDTSYATVYNYIPSLKWGTFVSMPISIFYESFTNILILSSVVMLVLLIVVIIISTQCQANITKPIEGLLLLTNRVATGDLTQEATLEGPEEIMEISKAFNHMIQSLRGITRKIQSQNQQLHTSASDLMRMSHSTESISKEITAAMVEIADGALTQATQSDAVHNNTKSL